MVYFGPSRGCWTCKRRRKKCDEVKPACMRCINSKRTCGGYVDSSEILFRPGYCPGPGTDWYSHETPKPQPFTSLARKCTLPKRLPFPGTDIWPPDVPPKEIPLEQFDKHAVQAFLWDFCIHPTTVSDARGFFRGLEPMLLRQGLHCKLGKAAMAVSFESRRRVTNREYLGLRGEKQYHEALSYMAKVIQDSSTLRTPETLLIASLLGLYEMMRAEESSQSRLNLHARGVGAILEIGNTLGDLIRAVRSGNFWKTLTGKSQPCSLFSLPSRGTPSQCLDDLLLIHDDIVQRSCDLLSEQSQPMTTTNTTAEIYDLLQDATALDHALTQWYDAQPHDFRPCVSGYMSPSRRLSLSAASLSFTSAASASDSALSSNSTPFSSPPSLSEASFPYSGSNSPPLLVTTPPFFCCPFNGNDRSIEIPPTATTITTPPKGPPPPPAAAAFWPGRIDTYHDPYIACVWNVYRTTRLSLINAILLLSKKLHDDSNSHHYHGHQTTHTEYYHQYQELARVLLQDMLASIPFHLVDDLHVFVREVASASAPHSGSAAVLDDEMIPNPGRPAGGVLLMLHLETVMGLESSLVGEDVREYCRTCLVWIAEEMGIGQAAVLARSPEPPPDIMRSAWVIMGVGMLL